MKLKCRPKDFQVHEVTSRQADGGPFAFYRLRKWSIGTLEVVHKIAKHCSVAPEQISVGGMKDRHALTEQHLTIEAGPARSFQGRNWQLEYLGQTDRPFIPADIQANRFWIVVRRLTRRAAETARQELPLVAAEGVPNYFDRQRFGSLGRSRQFVAEAWCRGDFQRALWLALADEGPHDRPRQRRQKQWLRQHWGNWAECLAGVENRQAHRVLQRLCRRPGDFRGAFARIDVRLRRIYLAAYQSFLWNRMLAAHLSQQCPRGTLFDVSLGVDVVPFFRSLPEKVHQQLAEATLPLPSARLRLPAGPLAQLIEQVLQAQRITLRELRVKYPRDSFFSSTERAVVFRPQQVSAAVHKDELYPGKRKLLLQFELPRGCYATLVVKRLIRFSHR